MNVYRRKVLQFYLIFLPVPSYRLKSKKEKKTESARCFSTLLCRTQKHVINARNKKPVTDIELYSKCCTNILYRNLNIHYITLSRIRHILVPSVNKIEGNNFIYSNCRK